MARRMEDWSINNYISISNAIARVSRGVTGISRIGKLSLGSLGQARPMSRSDKCRLWRGYLESVGNWNSLWRQYHEFSFWRNLISHELFSCSKILNGFWCCLWLLFWELVNQCELDYGKHIREHSIKQIDGKLRCQATGWSNYTILTHKTG